MKKISLFIAMSLDGYIADTKGSVNWLVGQSNDRFNLRQKIVYSLLSMQIRINRVAGQNDKVKFAILSNRNTTIAKYRNFMHSHFPAREDGY